MHTLIARALRAEAAAASGAATVGPAASRAATTTAGTGALLRSGAARSVGVRAASTLAASVAAPSLVSSRSAAVLGSALLRASAAAAAGGAGVPSRGMAAKAAAPANSREDVTKLRNIGISAHIDSGKTTLTERILFYTGRIDAIHEVKGKDGVGATMDSMELERERGITIKSAATYASWGDANINIIDTPGHVDFTIEVERALRVLDGAILVLCGVSGVQSQSITVDKQMKRYSVPRLAFINKLDRAGANPFRIVKDLCGKLRLNACLVQLPIGLEDAHKGVVDLITRKAFIFEGPNGETITEVPIPEGMVEATEKHRAELIERLAEVDDEVAEAFLGETAPSIETIKGGIRRAVIGLKFVPVFLGSAYKNKGVQKLLDGVVDYLPNPNEKTNMAFDRSKGEEVVTLSPDPVKPMVALAFKLQPSRFGQLTYMRIYQGTLRRGDFIYNVAKGEKVKVPRLVRMHSDQLEDIDAAGAGEIVATFGVDCASGDSFTTDAATPLTMSSMFVPEPVISYSIKPTDQKNLANFTKALQNFTKEDPTFRSHVDQESGEQIISGMGELHLDVYIQLLKREYGVETKTSPPRVNFRETITTRAEFNYLHKKQSGGAGQFARVIGYMEPIADIEAGEAPAADFEFVNGLVGNNVPPEYVPACEKGFKEAVHKGAQIGHPVQGVRVVLTDGQAHSVDSNEMAFKLAAGYAFREAFLAARPGILEPVMAVEVTIPHEFQGTAIGLLNKRKGQMTGSDTQEQQVAIQADVPLSQMFGFSTELRSATQGKGEFTMEYKTQAFVSGEIKKELMKKYEADRKAEMAAKK